MTERVHGFTQTAEAATGNWDFLTLYTTHPIAVTGVVQTLAEFKAAHGLATAVNISTLAAAKRTFLGVAIANDADYLDAYAQQSNFDVFVRSVSQFGNPVVVGTPQVVATLANPTTMALVDFAGTALVSAADFGTDLIEAAARVYAVCFAVERSAVFGTSMVRLATALSGAPVRATAGSIAIDTDVSGAAPDAGGLVLNGAVTSASTLTATKQSVVLVLKSNLLPFGGLASA